MINKGKGIELENLQTAAQYCLTEKQQKITVNLSDEISCINRMRKISDKKDCALMLLKKVIT